MGPGSIRFIWCFKENIRQEKLGCVQLSHLAFPAPDRANKPYWTTQSTYYRWSSSYNTCTNQSPQQSQPSPPPPHAQTPTQFHQIKPQKPADNTTQSAIINQHSTEENQPTADTTCPTAFQLISTNRSRCFRCTTASCCRTPPSHCTSLKPDTDK